MRELRSCDFCGSDATGVYEIVPGELDPSEDEQRRIVLCEDCRDTLETVLEPFLNRLSSGSDRPDESASQREGLRGTSSEAVAERGSGSGVDADEGSVEADTDEQSAEARADKQPAEARADEQPAEAGTDGQSTEASTDESDGSGDRSAASRSPSRPDGYRKVLRLLGNRDGALSREELIELVSNAYGLSEQECERVIDAALENGDLVEDAGTLQRV